MTTKAQSSKMSYNQRAISNHRTLKQQQQLNNENYNDISSQRNTRNTNPLNKSFDMANTHISFSDQSSQLSYQTAATVDTQMRGSVKSTKSCQSGKSNVFLKVVVIGDSNVGKTSIIEKFKDKKTKGAVKPTIGADFIKKVVTLNTGLRIPLQIWDTAGQERFQSLSNTFYRGTDCCVIVFDLCDYRSYEKVQVWRNNFIESQSGIPADQYDKQEVDEDEPLVPIILIGNKVDRAMKGNNRQVDTDQVLAEWIDSGLVDNYIETSAFTSQNINESFSIIADEANYFQTYAQVEAEKLNILNQMITLQDMGGLTKLKSKYGIVGQQNKLQNGRLRKRNLMEDIDEESSDSDENQHLYDQADKLDPYSNKTNKAFKLNSQKRECSSAQQGCCY